MSTNVMLAMALAAVTRHLERRRGHFRAAFEDFAPRERIIEGDGPGPDDPQPAVVAAARILRPVFPLDPETVWPR